MKTTKLFSVTFIAVLLLISTTTFGQIRLGIRADVGVEKPSFSTDMFHVDNMNAFKVGPTVEFMLPAVNFGIEGAVLYANNKMDVRDVNENGIGSVVDEIDFHYIDVPVNLKYKIGVASPLKIYLAAGPYARFLVAKDDFTFAEIGDKVKAKDFQAGVNLGAGVNILNHLQVGVNYGIKLTDNYSVDQPQWDEAFNNKDGVWSLTATIYF